MAALKLKQNEDGVGARCPSCGAALPEGAVLCVQCGHDLRTGRRVDDEAAPKRNPLTIAGVALLVAVAAGLVAWRLGGSGPAAPAPASGPAPVVAAAEPSSEAHPAPAPEVPTAVTNAAPAAVPDEAAPSPTQEVVAAGVESNALPDEPAVPAVDPVMVENEQRGLVTDQLDQKAPLYEPGDEVELRLSNGLVQRGKLQSRTAEGLVLQVASNLTKTVEFGAMDRASRVRSDPAYRARYLDFHVQQRVQKIVQQEVATPEAMPSP